MTDDTDPTLPQGGDTAPILERILEELRLMREDNASLRAEVHAVRDGVAALDAKLDALGRDLRTELAETRDVFRGELGLESRNLRALVADHERRLKELKDAGQPQ